MDRLESVVNDWTATYDGTNLTYTLSGGDADHKHHRTEKEADDDCRYDQWLIYLPNRRVRRGNE